MDPRPWGQSYLPGQRAKTSVSPPRTRSVTNDRPSPHPDPLSRRLLPTIDRKSPTPAQTSPTGLAHVSQDTAVTKSEATVQAGSNLSVAGSKRTGTCAGGLGNDGGIGCTGWPKLAHGTCFAKHRSPVTAFSIRVSGVTRPSAIHRFSTFGLAGPYRSPLGRTTK